MYINKPCINLVVLGICANSLFSTDILEGFLAD